MNIEQFMQGYKAAWEGRDERLFCVLFAEDGAYHNTPFAVQRGHAQLAEYWQRVKLQEDVQLRYEVLADTPGGGVAHWHVTYQVASEELFAIWARSTGTHLPPREPGCGGTASRLHPDPADAARCRTRFRSARQSPYCGVTTALSPLPWM